MKLKYRPEFGNISTPVFVLAIIFIIIGFLILSFFGFTFGYWLISLIVPCFFGVVLPFSWWYSLGAWLILLIFGACTGSWVKLLFTE